MKTIFSLLLLFGCLFTLDALFPCYALSASKKEQEKIIEGIVENEAITNVIQELPNNSIISKDETQCLFYQNDFNTDVIGDNMRFKSFASCKKCHLGSTKINRRPRLYKIKCYGPAP